MDWRIPRVTKEEARKMGRDCAKNGPNEKNCHFSIFGSPENTRAWEQGKKEATKET